MFCLFFNSVFLVGHVCSKNSRAGVRIGRRNVGRSIHNHRRLADSS